MKASTLIKKSQCPSKALFDGLDFPHAKRTSGYFRDALETLLSEPLATWDLEATLDATFPTDFFETLQQKEAQYTRFKKRVERFRAWLVSKDMTIVAVKPEIVLDLHAINPRFPSGELMTVRPDVLIEGSGGVQFFSNVSLYQSPFGATARTKAAHRQVQNSMEMFLLGLATREYMPKTKAKMAAPSLYYLTSRQDSSANFVGFNEYPQDNTVVDEFVMTDVANAASTRHTDMYNAYAANTNQTCTTADCENCGMKNICQYDHIVPLKATTPVGGKKKAGTVTWTTEQQSLIDFEIGVCRSNAVAGAGKTTVVANRIMNLVKKGYDPSSCLLITFTEKGVREMREKIEYWLHREGMNPDILNQLNIFTFNGFGQEIINRYHARLGFVKEPVLVDRIDRIELIKTICDNHPAVDGLRYETPYWKPAYAKTPNSKGVYLALSDYFDLIKPYDALGLMGPDEIAQEVGVSEEVMELFDAFQSHMYRECLIDFDDQIKMAAHLLSDFDVVNELKFAHVIVDEFQDSSAEQLYMVQQLAEGKRFLSLMVCGDDSQSIYSWRGANQENIIRFNELFTKVVDLPLTNNFRTTEQIATLANAVNGLNLNRVDKDIVAHKHGLASDYFEGELDLVVDRVKQAITAGHSLSEIAIIGRTRKELIKLHHLLSQQDIPNVLAVSELLSQNEQACRFIQFADYVLNEGDVVKLCEYLQFSDYEAYAASADRASWFKNRVTQVNLQLSVLNEKEKYALVLEHLNVLADTYPACKKLKEVAEAKNFPSLYHFVTFLNKIELHDSDLAIPGVEGADAVVLTTAHASKGREFDVVITLVSSFKRMGDRDSELPAKEEERRLLFVAMTRAKEELALWSCDGKHPFVFELKEIESNTAGVIKRWAKVAVAS